MSIRPGHWLSALVLVLALPLAGCSPQVADTGAADESAVPAISSNHSVPSAESVPPPRSAPVSAPHSGASPRRADNNHLLLGNPSNAGKNTGAHQDNYLIEREAFAMSYNRRDGGPNWVAWHLDKGDRGSAPRSDFMPDPLLPSNWQIRPTDYRNSGYDRGHVCPSADRTRDRALNQQTFVMSNMLPQAPALNQQVWKDFEDYSRSLIRNNELYIIAGGHGSSERIAGGKVNVPAVCWKIVVVLPLGDNDLSRINQDTRVIAVSMPNRDREEIADSQWTQWITSVDQLEKTTGYDFLSDVPDGIEQVLEKKKDPGTVGRSSAGRRSSTEATSRNAPAAPPVVVRKPAERAPGQAGQVWVNTSSGIYHRAGCQWYGTTKEGEFMSEAQALKLGHRVARDE